MPKTISATVIKPLIHCILLLGALAVITGCDRSARLDEQLQDLITQHQLDGPFEADIEPQSQELAELGGQLFFSPDLSIDGAVSCASCHHPDFGGGDGIALPIGIGGVDSRHVGQQRIDAAREANPDVSLEGLIPRHSPSIINAALFRQNLFWDGRVQYQEDDQEPGGKSVVAGVFGAGQANPSGYLQQNLLQTQARMPLTSTFEMKGGLAPNKNNHEIEQDILHFLQSNAYWCEAFAAVFGEKPCHELIDLNHLTQALAEFQATQVLTDSPFERYIRGETSTLNAQQKRGAIAFLRSKDEGGAGCVACHSGKTFTNEQFYNINIPPSGRGANNNGWDLGRNNVDKSAERFSFRVPMLLNVAKTGPYFHNGVATTLEDAIRHKQTAADAEKPATQIKLPDIDYDAIYKAITEGFKQGSAKALLPERLSEKTIQDITAFLHSLTDDCLLDAACRESLTHEVIESPRERVAQRSEKSDPRETRDIKPPALDCSYLAERATEPDDEAGFYFTRHNLDIGIDHQRSIGLIRKGWLIDVINYASVSAQDLNYNCLDDLVFDAGTHGLVVYKQQADGQFKRRDIPYTPMEGAVNALVMDVDGDYRPDLFIGNYGQGSAAFVYDFLAREDDVVIMHELTGPVINASVGDVNNNGNMDVVFAFWRSFSSLIQPHVWFNDGHGNLSFDGSFLALRQHERHMGGGPEVKRVTSPSMGTSDLTFTPNLVDINHSGYRDLLLAADFFRSQVLENREGRFVDITDKTVINDSNGMGVAIGDFNHNGLLDWFVTSIVDSKVPMIDGHKLYMNQGEGVFKQKAIVNKEEEWSWAACAADFNNNGHLDIFYISGFAEAMATAIYEDDKQEEASDRFLDGLRRFSSSVPTLLINDGKGNFTDQSEAWGFTEPLDGRGVACFDYRQNGAIDIVVTPLEGSPVLFQNQVAGKHNWLALRFLGLPGNTEALGTKVTLHTANGQQYRQVRFENNFVSRNPAQLHFGLDALAEIDKLVIELPAPHNKTVELTDLAINQLHVLKVEDLLD